jgi:hypothetical protein
MNSMAGIIHTTVPTRVTRRRLLSGTVGVFAGVAGGRMAMAQNGTPVSESTANLSGGPERIASLLQLIPATYGDVVAQQPLFCYYADVQRQLEATGVEPYQPGSDSLPEGFIDATGVLALAAQAYNYGLVPEFVETFGFSPLQAEESMLIGAPPHDLTIFRGGLDLEALTTAWQASGYARETVASGAEVWTAGKEGELDLTTLVSKYGLGALNNAAIIGDDTVVFGRYFTDIEAVVNQVADPQASLVDHAGLEATIATLGEDTVSIVATTGAFLDVWSMVLPEQRELIEEWFDDSDEATGLFPDVNVAAFGITAGAIGPAFTETGQGTPDASPVSSSPATEGDGGVVQVRLDVGSEEAAGTAVAAVDYRWNGWQSAVTGDPYTDLMTIVTAEPLGGGVAAIDFRPVVSNRVWLDMVLRRDLLPFAWRGDEPVATPEVSPTAAG